ncbi:MAG: beta-propeller domain-containing protein, partial [Bacillota bacterium]
MRKSIVLLLILTLVISGGAFAEVDREGDSIALHIGSPLILAGEDIKSLDSENPSVVPVIHKDRTLVPLRAISEHFGAQASYDEEERIAVILYEGAEYLFPIDKNYYEVHQDGEYKRKVEFDTETLIIHDRTMVPLRVIAEDILKMDVAYDSRVIFIGTRQENVDDQLVENAKIKIGQALKINSREELLALVKGMDESFMEEPAREPVFDSDTPAMSESEMEEQAGSKDWSSTNEQVQGINEADIVKTDGTFIYVATRDSIKVYRANDGQPVLTDEKEVSIDKETGEYVEYSELYIHDGRLVVLGRKGAMGNWIRPLPEPGIMPDVMAESIMPYGGREYVHLGVYGVSDSGKLNLIKEVEVEGSLLSSRKKDDHVYLVVNKYMGYYGPYDQDPIPVFRDTAIGNDYRELPVESILYHPGKRSPNYLLVAAVNIVDKDEPANIEAFLGSGSEIYMSENALYVAGNDYSSFWGSVTNIARFSVDETKIGYTGGGMVEGTLLNQFSMDEYDGNLRLATTKLSGENLNCVYILDRNLNQI